MRRPASVMEQANDGLHPERGEARQASVGPAPICMNQPVGRDFFPKDRVPKHAYSRRGDQVEIGFSTPVSGELELAMVSIADSVDRALDAAPELHACVHPRAELSKTIPNPFVAIGPTLPFRKRD